MDTIDTFCTERLTAVRLLPEDFGDLCRMHQDPKVMATLSGVRSDEETRRFLQISLEHWDGRGFGLWMFRETATGQFVGRAGLREVHVGGNDEVELAYGLMSEFWGQGLATEIARACLKIAFEQLDMTHVVTFTLTTNRASQRVMEKAGFTYEREIVHAGLPHVLYRITGKAAVTGACSRG